MSAPGANLPDSLRLHYLEVLSARAQALQGRVKSILAHKLALAEDDSRLRQAQTPKPIPGTARAVVDPAHLPLARSESLRDLVRSMAQAEPDKGNPDTHESVATGLELKAVRLSRNTWSRLSADKQLNAALDQAPKNAGPINSHMLVLRSLALMRDLSPDYLSRFISYADTLVHLEQGEKPKARRTR